MIYNNFRNKKYHLIFAMYFLGFGILIAIIVSFVNYQSSFTNIEKKIRKIADTEIENKRNYLYQYVHQTEML